MNNPINQTPVPTAKISKGTTSDLKVDFYSGNNAYYLLEIGNSNVVSGEIHDAAKLLVEHMDIIEDSREQVKLGNTVTWDELKKKAKKGRK